MRGFIMDKIRVLVWNENYHERKSEKIRAVYPEGIHGAIAEGLRKYDCFDVSVATLDMPEHGLTEEVLNNTDVLIWWSHCQHAEVADDVA
jgi:trehalose utilization protein